MSEKTFKKVVLNLSGGLDSTTLAYYLVDKVGSENVHAVSFSYGQKQSVELELAAQTCKKLSIEHKIIDISFYGDIVKSVSTNIQGSDVDMPTIQDVLGDPQPPTYLPFRNLIFLSLTSAYAESNGCDAIALAIQSRDLYGYWDTTQPFIDNYQEVIKLNRMHEIQVVTPFVHMDKREELELGVKLGVDYSLTLSCYDPDAEGKSCGTCPTCAERIKAFMDIKVKDPVPYQIDMPWIE